MTAPAPAILILEDTRTVQNYIRDVLRPIEAKHPILLARRLAEAQEIAAKHALRPINPAILKKYASTFKPIQLFTVEELFGSLAEAQKVHFNDGGQFDKLYTVK